jgi:hypothetical protein
LKEIQTSAKYIANAVGTPPDTFIEINLNSREFELGEFKDFLGMATDHRAGTVWFKVDRFYDDVDLFGATCWIQYRNALGEDYVAVALPKVIRESDHDMLYIPWPICSPATKAAGDITFSFRFFKIGESKKVLFFILL